MLGGFSRSSISGEKSENCRGETDYWIVKLADENLSVFNNAVQNSIVVYPTLTTGEVSIMLNKSLSIHSVLLTDYLGKTLEFKKGFLNKITISGESGLYILTIIATNGEKQTFKIVKINQ